MLDNNFYCVLLAGGSGDKLWPWSRESKPNQFVPISEGKSTLLKKTYERCLRLVPKENIIIATLDKFRDLVEESVPGIPPENVLLEPIGRHTAPCVIYSAYTIISRNPNAVMAMVPADSFIDSTDKIHDTMEKAMTYASEHDVLLTMGVVPTRPETRYGYIQAAGGKKARNAGTPTPVKTFTEKPELSIAEAFCRSGEFFWNSGIYIWKASVIKKECEDLMPSITKLFSGWEDKIGKPQEKAFISKVYADCPKLSIDYGLMEKTENAWIYPIDFKWKDFNDWDELYENAPKTDEHGNICNTKASIIKDCRNTILLSDKRDKLIAVRGLEDYVVVDTEDVLLICPRNKEEFNDLAAHTGIPELEKYR